jgi:hypothetical protein
MINISPSSHPSPLRERVRTIFGYSDIWILEFVWSLEFGYWDLILYVGA